MLRATNPFNGEVIGEYPELDEHQMAEHIGLARSAWDTWRYLTYAQRADVLNNVAAELRNRKSELAELMALEMGKPVAEGGPEVEKAAWCAEHYAEYGEQYLADQELASDASSSYIHHQPLGVVLGILPWNAPLWLASRFFAPALMAGNTCVLKHDQHVPGCARAVADVFVAAGAPGNILVNLPIGTSLIDKAIRDPRVAGVSFTGSTNSGSKVAAAAGAEIKPVVLELGGSDPNLVMADADLDEAADVVTRSRMINAGQSCIAAKRIIVEQSIYDDFVERLRTRLAKLRQGDPLLPETDVGPIARKDLQEGLHRQVTKTISEGARCLLGGELPESEGYFYPTTLLVDVNPGMCAFKEETFGPVMVVTPAADLEEALALANNSEYGLGAAIWTGDDRTAEKAIEHLEAGQVAVNGIVKTDPRLPSGGIKKSGIGRELGPHGIREFVNAKQVWIK